MPKLLSNHLELEYDEFGSPSAPVVLLVMGLGTQMTAWTEEFCGRIAAAGYRVIRFDNRDIGLSEKLDGQRTPNKLKLIIADLFKLKPKVPYTLEDMANDATGVLDALDIEHAHIVGASMGGMIAQILTAKNPERVLSLTSIMSTSGRRGLPKTDKSVIQKMLQRPDDSDHIAYLEHAVKIFQLIGSPGYPRTKKAWEKLITASMQRSTYPQGYHRQLAAVLAAGSRVELLKTINTPTLIIHGKNDLLIKVEHGIDTAKCIANSRLEIIDGMGHDLPPRLVPALTDLLIDHFMQTSV